MTDHRIVRSEEEVLDAYENSVSACHMAKLLGVKHHTTAQNMSRTYGLEVPALHWGCVSSPEPPDQPLTFEERFEEDKLVQRLRAELAEQKKLYAAVVKTSNLYEDVLDVARECFGKTQLTRLAPPRVDESAVEEDAILTWADWHGGEVVDYDVMQGFNSYDPVIMCRRAQYTVDRTLKLLFDFHTNTCFKTLHVFDLGDSITGDLLDDNKATNAITVFEAVRLVAQVKAAALTELSAHIPVTYTVVPGNHGRRSAKMPWKQPTETADWLIGEMVGDMVSGNERITTVIPKAWTAVVSVQGHNHSLNHGYSAARGGYGGIPWYSFQRMDGKLTALESVHDRLINYRWYGHIHQGATLPKMDGSGEQFIVGSLKGGDEYALNELAAYADPLQILVGCHKDVGVSWRYPLNVNRGDSTASRYERFL